MKYAVKKSGSFTGTTYDRISGRIRAHHDQYGEDVVPVAGLENAGTDDNPAWEAVDLTLGDAYVLALSRLKSAHTEALSNAHDRYAPTEREGWHELVKDAEVGSGECLEAYAEDLGVSVSDAASRVMTSRDKYRAAYGKATGHLTKLRDEADTLFEVGDTEGLKALEW